MTRTHFHDDHTMIVRGRTSAYQPRPDGGFRISIPVFDTDGATSLFTTVGDLLRWEQNFVDARIGGRALVDEAQVSGRLNDGTEAGYGWGLAVGAYRGVRVVGHGGADAGYRADVIRFPDHDLAIAAFCNLSTIAPGELTRQVADVLLPASALAPLPTPIDAAGRHAGAAGRRLLECGDRRRPAVAVVDGGLRSSPTGPAAAGLRRRPLPRRTARRRAAVPAAAQAGRRRNCTLLAPPLAPAVFKRLPPVAADVDLAPFAGGYHSVGDLGCQLLTSTVVGPDAGDRRGRGSRDAGRLRRSASDRSPGRRAPRP